MPLPPTQMLIYRFGSGASFEGQLAGALERIESGGSVRVLDALFVTRDGESGEMSALAVSGSGAGGLAGPLIGFRMDAAERSRATERALSERSGARAETLHALAALLAPGEAMAAVLVDHRWARALEDAVARTGGTAVASEFVDTNALEGTALMAAAAPSGA
jgi:hypothetical protein